jgi:hypothetical protein
VADALDYKSVSRPNGWKHAPACHTQSQFPRRAQYLAREFALQCVGLSRIHETFDGLGHVPSVPVFEQERAEVTKTCS